MVNRITDGNNGDDIFQPERRDHLVRLNGKARSTHMTQDNNYAGPPKEDIESIKAKVAAANEKRFQEIEAKRGNAPTHPDFHKIRARNMAARQAEQKGNEPGR